MLYFKIVYLQFIKIIFLKKATEDESENEIDEDDVKANGGIRKNSIVEQLVASGNGNKRKLPSKKPVITIIVDLAFSTNVRFLDDHELYLDNVELYRVSTKHGIMQIVSATLPQFKYLLCIVQ